MRVVGEVEHANPVDGEMDRLMATVPWNPLRLWTVIVEFPPDLAGKVSGFGLAEMETPSRLRLEIRVPQ